MEIRLTALLCAALLLLSPFAALAAQEQALEVLTLLSEGEFAKVFDLSTPIMQQTLVSPEGYLQLWSQLEALGGPFQRIGDISAAEQAEYVIYTVEADFELSVLTMNVVFDRRGLLAGLSVSAVEPKAIEGADEGEIILLREGREDETQARLLLPEGEGPFPVVVLVHGSGPSDMNEAVYGMTPFLDLAKGLKERGIATLRYDKYTYAHGAMLSENKERLAAFTMNEEYVLDAVEACQKLREDKRISSVFLLGHSQGAYAVPRIAKNLPDGSLAGMILLSGSPLSITDIIYRQNMDAMAGAALGEETLKQEMAKLDQEAAKVAQLSDMTEEELKATVLYGSMSGWYIKDEMAWAPARLLLEMPGIPALIVQGGKDWQVTEKEGLEAWQTALQGRENTDYLRLPNLTHLLFDLKGPSAGNATDYAVPVPVSNGLIDALSSWIASHTSTLSQ